MTITTLRTNNSCNCRGHPTLNRAGVQTVVTLPFILPVCADSIASKILLPVIMPRGLLERLRNDECVLAAEGYLLEFEARGYLKAGSYVPEVVLEHPALVRQLHEEFVHAGSDVVIAFTYYTHREKMRLIGREGDLAKINMEALRIAREVADDTGTLMAGNICNSNALKLEDPASVEYVQGIFKEQLEWAQQGGADFIVAETFSSYAEAALALKVCKQVVPELPVVVTLAVQRDGLYDGVDVAEACRRLEEAGADVVGLNCTRGPNTMLPLLKEIRAAIKGPLAAVPVPYRTSKEYPTYYALESYDGSGRPAFPNELEPWYCTRQQIKEFTEEARKLGVQYLGLCCGNRAGYFREMAMAAGKHPPAAKYAPDMSQHWSRVNTSSMGGKQFQQIYKC